tara:strand:- start:7513 stop:7926 length:414 start_codon:yes stop_codon:yes gene_type:complete
MTKLLLNIEEEYDFFLIGISCHAKDYRLCWEMNRLLNIDLARTEDLDINLKTSIGKFSFYEFIDEENYSEYFLISNRSAKGFLIPEQKNTDFLFMIKGAAYDSLIEEISEKIGASEIVLTSYNIDVDSLKSKQNLLF